MSIHILWTEPHKETYRRTHREDQWCFVCRAKRQFDYVVMSPVEVSWYGPYRQIECTTCKTVDGDCFPGTQREWED